MRRFLDSHPHYQLILPIFLIFTSLRSFKRYLIVSIGITLLLSQTELLCVIHPYFLFFELPLPGCGDFQLAQPLTDF